MGLIGLLWDAIIMRPMINSLALLYDVLFDNMGLSIIVFTLLIRFALIPLTIRQTNSMKKMQSLQPRLKALQAKYKGKSGGERKQLSQETMKLYREAGVNPVGCLGPMIIQMPIWIGLYRAILKTMPPTPEGVANLSDAFYSWNPAQAAVPLNSNFIGVDLVDFVQAASFPFNFLLPVLVGGTMYVQQKMTSATGMTASSDPNDTMAQTNRMMVWMMPIMFGIFTFQFPAGLAFYILFSNIAGVVIQYFVGGQKPVVLFGRSFLGSTEARAEAALVAVESGAATSSASRADTISDEAEPGETESDEPADVYRQDRRRSDRRRPGGTRRRSRRRRNKGR